MIRSNTRANTYAFLYQNRHFHEVTNTSNKRYNKVLNKVSLPFDLCSVYHMKVMILISLCIFVWVFERIIFISLCFRGTLFEQGYGFWVDGQMG